MLCLGSGSTHGGSVDLDPPCTKTGEDGCSTGQSGLSRQRLGFKKGMAIASLNVNPIVVGLFDSTILVGGAKKPPPT